MQNFEGKIAVVTGGGSGIGRALVLRLAKEGCHIATCDIRESGLEETRRLVATVANVQVTTFVADVADERAGAIGQPSQEQGEHRDETLGYALGWD